MAKITENRLSDEFNYYQVELLRRYGSNNMRTRTRKMKSFSSS